MHPRTAPALALPLCLLLLACSSNPRTGGDSGATMSDTAQAAAAGQSTQAHHGIDRAALAGMARDVVERSGVPGLVVILLDSQGIRQVAAHGTRVAGGDTAISPDDYFHIGSTAKSLLAVLAAQAVEQGLLRWDTRLFERLPDWQQAAHPAYADTTLAMLLQSRAGLQAYTDLRRDPVPAFTGTRIERRHAFLKAVLARPPAAKRRDDGFAHLYSNASFVMAAAMLETVSGNDYETLVQQYLATTLLADAVWGWPNAMDEQQPWGHRMRGKRIVEVFAPDHAYALPDVLGPAGNLSMTATDFARYVQQHLRGLRGEDNTITSESYRLIHYGHTGFSFGVANGRYAGHRLSGMDGSATTFFCRALLFPDDDFALTILINAAALDGRSAAADRLAQQILNRRFSVRWLDRLKMWLGAG